MDIKILLADDHEITRDGLAALIEKEEGMTVVAQAKNGREAVEKTLDHSPDVIVMDIHMPELNGIEATRQILLEMPHVKIITLSMYSEKRYITNMLKAGVAGYLLKNDAFEELVRAIRAVVNNQGYLSPKIAHIVMKEYAVAANDNIQSQMSSLTKRERELLQLIAEGRTNNEIADRLCVSVKTVASHRGSLKEKLNIKSIAELTKIAIREGLVSLE